ncbi:MAG: efflux RND transporter periplasmic adaptor subunit, partial [Oscillospiraceae bacterium]
MAERGMNEARAAYDASNGDPQLLEAYNAAKIAYNEVANAHDNFVNGYQAQYNQLTQGLEQIEISLDMAEKAYDLAKGDVHEEQLKTIKAQLAQAQVGYEMAMQKLSYSSVVSPISGVVEQKNIELHSMAGQSSPAFIITEKSALNVTFGVSAEIASSMKVGDMVKIESTVKSYEAPIVEIAGIIDPQSGLFTVKAQITESAPELLSGVAVKLTAQTAKNPNAIIIGAETLYHQNNEAYVFVNKDGKAVRKTVKTGIITDTTAEILEGITESDEIITSWNPSLTDGAAITVKQEV